MNLIKVIIDIVIYGVVAIGILLGALAFSSKAEASEKNLEVYSYCFNVMGNQAFFMTDGKLSGMQNYVLDTAFSAYCEEVSTTEGLTIDKAVLVQAEFEKVARETTAKYLGWTK